MDDIKLVTTYLQTYKDDERPWSNFWGSTVLPAKEETAAPTGYQWTQDDWQLDTTGPWVDDSLGIGKNISRFLDNEH